MIAIATFDTRDARCYTGCPSFFKSCCAEAAAGRGYEQPGFHLTIHLEGQIPYALEDNDEWDQFMVGFQKLVRAGNDSEILAWFDRWFPECMKLVPRGQRWKFVQGVFAGAVHLGWIDANDE